MLDQNIITLLSNTITLVGTLTAVVIGAILTYRFTRKVDKSKAIREKIEEIYLMAVEVKLSIDIEFQFLGRQLTQQPPLSKSLQDQVNPINKLVVMADLYAPSLDKYIMELRNCVVDLRSIRQSLMSGSNSLTGKEITDCLLNVSTKSDEIYEELRNSIQKLIKKHL